ncbi:hypothetical protein [Microbulbifer sp. THAF38]|uniref:DUF6966 domain-containing protein n=1 Tax=Microbulbifer sp. THAF38 TaxID=2587856 RepID=UPI001267BA4B|nr:hypothetical protein [Microbulbifer sp. THAF38]QFT54454.1 hypothetical protein FIU95_07795 [Microbulbifer sp. THAF38]
MELDEAIKSFNELLSKYGVKGWKLSEVRTASSARNVLSKFGGMGSINDIYICAANGHNIKPEHEMQANTELHELLERIYELCKAKAQ